MKRNLPPIYAVYDHPKDYPDYFVVRKWIGLDPELKVGLYKDLEKLRGDLKEMGLYRMDRSPGDDKTIIECWI